jgi:hypothetical protein
MKRRVQVLGLNISSSMLQGFGLPKDELLTLIEEYKRKTNDPMSLENIMAQMNLIHVLVPEKYIRTFVKTT